MNAEDLAVVGVGDNFDEAFVLADDRGARIRGERELADLHVVSCLAGPGFCQADAADFRMAVRRTRNVFGIDGLARLASNFRYGHDCFHSPDVGKLRRAQHDVADGVNAGFGGLHPGIRLDEFAVWFDLGAFQTDILRARFAAYCDQDFFRVDLLLLAVDRDGHGNSSLRLLNLVDLRIRVEVDAALAEDTREFFGYFFILHGNQPRQHFDDRDFAIERAINRSELHAHRSGADYHERLRNFFEA